jgi:hypothetical protein
MPTEYSVIQKSPTGQRIRLLDRVIKIDYILTENNIGVAKLDAPNGFDIGSIQEDSQFEIWRRVEGGKKYRDGDALWLLRDWDHMIDEWGRERISLLCYSGLEIIDRAIVAYASGTANASKTDYTDDLMKALVRENLGTLAVDTARDISSYLAVAPDASLGPAVSKSMAWRKLLPTLQELSQEADDQGTRVFFDVVQDVSYAAGLVFKTYLNYRGTDRSGSGGGGRVILSPQNGTISSISRAYVSSMEKNYIYAGGQDTESDRDIEEDSYDDRIALSPFNRRELFVSATNVEKGDSSGLLSEAAAALKKYRPYETFSIKARDTHSVKFGREYKFGDRVAVDFSDRYLACRLHSVQVSKYRGRETIRPELRVDG